MTYAELLNILYTMDKDRLEDTITIFDPYTDELTAVLHTGTANEEDNDQLDPGHFYLVLKA